MAPRPSSSWGVREAIMLLVSLVWAVVTVNAAVSGDPETAKLATDLRWWGMLGIALVGVDRVFRPQPRREIEGRGRDAE